MNQMETINEPVSMKNRLMMGGGGGYIVYSFRKKYLWGFISFVISEVTYGKKGQRLWVEIPKYFGNKAPTKLQRDFRGNTDLYKVCCYNYCPFYIDACH